MDVDFLKFTADLLAAVTAVEMSELDQKNGYVDRFW